MGPTETTVSPNGQVERCASPTPTNFAEPVTGEGVDAIALDGFEPVEEVNGMADTWWRGNDSLVALYTGEAECMSAPVCRTALIFSGLDG